MGLVKSKSKVRVKFVSKIIKPFTLVLANNGSRYTFSSKPYFDVIYEYYNQPKQVNTFLPPSKKKADKVYDYEVLKTKEIRAKYILGEKRVVKYNNQTYNISKEVDFDRLYHNLETECALENL